MDKEFLGLALKDWAWFIGGLLTLIGVIRGFMEYVKSNRIKRADFLEKLILEFNDPKMFLAKRILDDFWIDLEGGPKTEISDDELVKRGSIEKKDPVVLRDLVKDLLRDHSERSVTGQGEQRARQSFDDILDFFTKLEYYLSLKLISKDELYYFDYYIRRCAFKASGAVRSYAERYGYPSLFRLFYVLQIKPKDKDRFENKLEFNSSRQERYYHDLRYGIPGVSD
jgi:hypothetical protein